MHVKYGHNFDGEDSKTMKNAGIFSSRLNSLDPNPGKISPNRIEMHAFLEIEGEGMCHSQKKLSHSFGPYISYPISVNKHWNPG